MRRSGAFGMPNGKPSCSKSRSIYEFKYDGNDRIDRNDKAKIPQISFKTYRAGNHLERRLTWKRDGRENDVESGSEAKGDYGEVYSAQSERRQSNYDSERQGCKATD